MHIICFLARSLEACHTVKFEDFNEAQTFVTYYLVQMLCTLMSGENRQLVADEPVKFEK